MNSPKAAKVDFLEENPHDGRGFDLTNPENAIGRLPRAAYSLSIAAR
jgi:hypothetical protein